RQARGHILLSEWRWPFFAPVYQNKHVRFIQPQYGLGVGGLYLHTTIQQDLDPPEFVTKKAGFYSGPQKLDNNRPPN
ncbi:MAG: hypothetical protein ACRDGA_04075, partial [Bacteroidota bacterium]